MARKPANVVAFGSSLTLHTRCNVRLGGLYLDPLPAALARCTGGAEIVLRYHGLEGFTSRAAAHRVADSVLPFAPDLVLLEFAHNDVESTPAEIVEGIDAIVEQVRQRYPACEFVDVLFANVGTEHNLPTAAMQTHSRIADAYGFPTFDCATPLQRIVASGAATWHGGERPLTIDGIHHSALVTEMVGTPFAAAFCDLVAASLELSDALPATATSSSPLARAKRSSLRKFADDGWDVGPPSHDVHCVRSVAAYVEAIAIATQPGATVCFSFFGREAYVWAMALGSQVEVVVDGARSGGALGAGPPNLSAWARLMLVHADADAHHTVEIHARTTPLVMGDLFYVGELD